MKFVLSILLIAYTFAVRAQFGAGINITPPSEINNAWPVAVADLDDDGNIYYEFLGGREIDKLTVEFGPVSKLTNMLTRYRYKNKLTNS